MKYTNEIIEKVLIDFKSGKNKSQLEREYNIPRSTIKYWIDNEDTIFISKTTDKPLDIIVEEIKNNKEIYNYILGLYLGTNKGILILPVDLPIVPIVSCSSFQFSPVFGSPKNILTLLLLLINSQIKAQRLSGVSRWK